MLLLNSWALAQSKYPIPLCWISVETSQKLAAVEASLSWSKYITLAIK